MSSELDYLFNPRSIAVVGLSSDPDKVTGMKWVTSMQEMGFKGALYPVSSSFNEINGLKVYSSLTDIPDEVDLVIGCVPARYAPQLVEDCVTKKVKFLQFFTAGFSETGDVDGVVLEQKITEIAGRGNLRIVGPNCMGVYSPRHCISWRSDFPTESGPVAVISQSGMNAVKMVNTGKVRGVRFSNLISYGNAVDLNEVDFLNYFAADSESKVIVVYIEGVKNAPQFLDALRNAAITKPVIVLKGGSGIAATP
ncbi:MAG: CoA-binding protein, partial [Chloroflexota bacterium]|nr:CoA-binding protein [Chloroflexota bacterium]